MRQFIKTIKDFLIENETFKNSPILYYHGGKNLKDKQIQLPLFLTPQKDIAEWYANERGGWINEFEVKWNKPLESIEDWKNVMAKININYSELNGEKVWILNNKKDYGGNILDIIYYEPFKDAAKEMGFDVVVGYDAGLMETSGVIYLPLYRDKVKFINSYQIF